MEGQENYNGLLKARDKNELLKYRLGQELELLDRRKKLTKHILSNDIFEERKEAYRLQREVTDIELRQEEKKQAEEAKKKKGWEALRRRRTFLAALAGLAGKKEYKSGLQGTHMALLSPDKEYCPQNRIRSANDWKERLIPELELNRSKSLVVLSSFWVGDPKAIDSVRRDRKTPEEMGTYTRFLQGFRHAARKSIRSGFCSRQRCRGAYIGDAGYTDVSHMNVAKLKKKAKSQVVKEFDDAPTVIIPDPAIGKTAGGVIKSILTGGKEGAPEIPKSRENSNVSVDSGIGSASPSGLSRSRTLPQILEETESESSKKSAEGTKTIPSRPLSTASSDVSAGSTSGLYSRLAQQKPSTPKAPTTVTDDENKSTFGVNQKYNPYSSITSPIRELRRLSTNFLNREDVVTVDVNKSVRIHKTVNFNADAVEAKKHLVRRRIILPDMIL